MAEYAAVVHKGGAVLWADEEASRGPIQLQQVALFVQRHLLDARSAGSAVLKGSSDGGQYSVDWTVHNGLHLVFMLVRPQSSAPHAQELLSSIKTEFSSMFEPGALDYRGFNKRYQHIRHSIQPVRGAAQGLSHPLPTSSSDTEADTSLPPAAAPELDADGGARNGAASDERPTASQPVPDGGPRAGGAFDIKAMERMQRGQSRKGRFDKNKGSDLKATDKEKGKGKQQRRWGNGPREDAVLDYSDAIDAEVVANEARAKYGSSLGEPQWTPSAPGGPGGARSKDPLEGDGEDSSKGLLSNFLKSVQLSIVGKEAVTAADLKAAGAAMQSQLQERNVSAEVATQICESVQSSLVGTRLASLTGVDAVVRNAVEATLTSILSTQGRVDIMADIRAHQARGCPYSIVFVGVNGVGKSTNLAKVAYWLKTQNLKVLVAACDTFRSGAVEQLKTHCSRLELTLCTRGYNKDPTSVASEALRKATGDGFDVVLIDTAGRMQDNEPLMKELSSIIYHNSPSLVLFVGEALAGNNGVDQLVKFNQHLKDLAAPGTRARLIDGVLVTKMDVVGHKVGAVISMAYSSPAPIMFIGYGQTYSDLKLVDVRTIVRSLLK